MSKQLVQLSSSATVWHRNLLLLSFDDGELVEMFWDVEDGRRCGRAATGEKVALKLL